MTEWAFEIREDLVEELSKSIGRAPVHEVKDGRPIYALNEETVARVEGLKIEVFSNEHPPPHFRVKYQGSTANFRINDCERINGSGDILRYEKNIRLWWGENKQELIDTWNRMRPSDCPVGEYKEDEAGE